jgi:hypothetical protein
LGGFGRGKSVFLFLYLAVTGHELGPGTGIGAGLGVRDVECGIRDVGCGMLDVGCGMDSRSATIRDLLCSRRIHQVSEAWTGDEYIIWDSPCHRVTCASRLASTHDELGLGLGLGLGLSEWLGAGRGDLDGPAGCFAILSSALVENRELLS